MNWNYQEIQPIHPLNQYIECVWTENFSDINPSSLPHHIVPDNSIELIFTDSIIIRSSPFIQENRKMKSHLTGLKSKYQKVIVERSPLIGVRFKPNGLYPFSKLDLKETIDTFLSPEICFGKEIGILEAQLFEAINFQKRVQLIEQFFLKSLQKIELTPDPTFDHIVQLIHHSKGRISIADLSKTFHISIKSIERKFLAKLGMTPKKYSRTIRLTNSLKDIGKLRAKQLTQISHEYDFYDQSHFIKEIKSCTGLSPSQYSQLDKGIQAPLLT